MIYFVTLYSIGAVSCMKVACMVIFSSNTHHLAAEVAYSIRDPQYSPYHQLLDYTARRQTGVHLHSARPLLSRPLRNLGTVHAYRARELVVPDDDRADRTER